MATVSITKEERQEIRVRTAKPLLYVGMVSIVMLFGGLTSGYIVRQAEGNWLSFEVPSAFYVSTVFIILSSITMVIANLAAKRNFYDWVTRGVALTLLLGIGFVISQFMGWQQLVDAGVFFTGKGHNAAGSFMYMLTGVHLAHLAGGLISLAITLFQASKKRYNSQNLLGLQLCSIYWHFLDILWVYLLLFLVFIR